MRNSNQIKIQDYYFFVRISPIILNSSFIKQNSSLKTYKLAIFKGTQKCSEQRLKRNFQEQMSSFHNVKTQCCEFNLINSSNRRPVQFVLKFTQICQLNQQKIIFEHKLYSYKLINNFLGKNERKIKEIIRIGFETEFLVQTFIQCSKQKLQQSVEEQKQNQYSIKISQQETSQRSQKVSNLNKKNNLSLLLTGGQNNYFSKSETSSPTAYKLGLFQLFGDEQQIFQFDKFNRPRFSSSAKCDASSQLTSQKNYSSLITSQDSVQNENQQKVKQISTNMDKYIGYHIQNQIETRSNRSKMSLASSKKPKSTIIRSFKKGRSSQLSSNQDDSTQITQLQDQLQYSLADSELQSNWQSLQKKTKIYYLALLLVIVGLLYCLLADGGKQIYRKRKSKKQTTKMDTYQTNHL